MVACAPPTGYRSRDSEGTESNDSLYRQRLCSHRTAQAEELGLTIAYGYDQSTEIFLLNYYSHETSMVVKWKILRCFSLTLFQFCYEQL